ncbi:MAG: MBL fold metallo-hydrolase, partial [Oligoflexia bacterium]|nr:MBL fold metallo-hydrolase [Oligoflexia bacterium]
RVLPVLAATAAAVAYAMAVGAPASARRAAVMVVAAAATTLLGRRPHPWTLLGMAAALVVLRQPGLVGDLGFQLSFSAVTGMLLVGPRITRLVPPDSPRLLRWVVGSLATTLGATAGILPIAALRFQQLAPVAPLANLLATPLIGGIGLPAALLGATVPGPVGQLAVAVADSAVGLGLDLLRHLDAPLWTPAVGPLGALLLGGAVLLCRRPTVAAGLAIIALGLRELPAGRLVVTFLSIGQGDAALVEWPDGRRWLVDGGPSPDLVLRYLRRRGIRHLDNIVLSHPHPDHITGLVPVMQELSVDSLWLPRRPTHDQPELLTLWQAAFAQDALIVFPDDVPPEGLRGVRVDHPRAGWSALGQPDILNEESLVLHIQHGRHSVLFAGDVEEDAERLLSAVLPPVTVVKVPHHGSASSSSHAFVARTRPALAVVSSGLGNRYGHPRPQAIAAWTLPAGAPLCGPADVDGTGGCRTRLLRTDTVGTVEWSSDGRRWSLRSWRVDQGWRDLPMSPSEGLLRKPGVIAAAVRLRELTTTASPVRYPAPDSWRRHAGP